MDFFRLDAKRLQRMEDELADMIPLQLLERGWDYYRRGKVQSVQVMGGAAIYGTVRGKAIYAVTLDGDDFGFSTCTCPYKGFCKHMAAVFFAYYDLAGESPDELYNRLIYGFDLVHAEAAANEETKQKQAQDASKGSGWLNEMERLHGQTWKTCRHSLHPLQNVLTSLKIMSKTWDERIRRVHWMHAILFVVEQAERAYAATDTFSRYYYEMAFARMTEPWLAQYLELANELNPEEMTGKEREAVDSLIKLFHDRDMDREVQLHRWETMYFALWSRLVADAAWRASEEAWLSAQMTEAAASGRQSLFYPMAIAFLAFVDRRDEEAIRLLGETEFNRTVLLACDCALQRLEEYDWTRLEGWVTYLYGGLSIERKSRAFGPFLTMCRIADERQPDNPAWQRYLVAFLPYSYSALTDHWINRNQFEQWTDLQLLLGIEPEDLDIGVVRELSKEAPQSLIPLYHQSIDTAIRSRNRQGYRLAVKQMKKLERLYRAEKQLHKWSRYVDGIVRKHHRLRALQEELWRGKIIT